MLGLRFSLNVKLPEDEALRYAWVGDAVLLLYARQRILKEGNARDDARCVGMTSNHFLATLGEPTRVEAEIGRRYLEHGWDSAAEWIETHLMPLHAKQQENRARRGAEKKGR